MAFLYFRDRVKFAVLEVGLGGRLDATNIVEQDVSVITSIGFDHQEFLGDTIEKIGAEKAGIIKSTEPVVVGPSAGLPVIREKAGNRLIVAREEDVHNIGIFTRSFLAIIRSKISPSRYGAPSVLASQTRTLFAVLIQQRGRAAWRRSDAFSSMALTMCR